jgi:hypothetical protein
MYKWLRRRVPGTARFGRRKLVLVHCGSVWILSGWAILAAPTARFARPAGGGLEFLDNPQWGLMWIVGGILAIANAIFRKAMNGRDVVGFAGMVTPPAVWLLFYMWSAIAFVSTRGEFGNPRAGLGILTWYLVWAFVLIVAGWPDPDDPDIEHPGERRDDA